MTPSKTNSEIADDILNKHFNGSFDPSFPHQKALRDWIKDSLDTLSTSKDKVILEREAEIGKLKTSIFEELTHQESLQIIIKDKTEKIQELEKELAFWKKTCEEGTYDLALKARVDGLSVELADAKQEISDIKSYSTGEVVDVANGIKSKVIEWLDVTGAIHSGNSWYDELLSFFDDEVVQALSSIHQKYRGELGEVREAIENSLEESVDRMCHPNRVIYGLSSKEEDAIKLKEALTKLTKLIGGK